MELNWYEGTFTITGVPEQDANSVVIDLSDDLKARHHLRPRQVVWDDSLKQVIVRVGFEGIRADQAGEQMAEELIEAASGVVPRFESLAVDTVSVEAMVSK